MTPHPQPKTRGIHCVGRVINENESPCPAWCIYEQGKIWCACYDAKNIHQWWGIQNLFYPLRSGAGAVLDEGIALIQKRIDGIFDAYRGETNEKLTEIPYAMANGMGESINMLIELRTHTKEMTERAEEER